VVGRQDARVSRVSAPTADSLNPVDAARDRHAPGGRRRARSLGGFLVRLRRPSARAERVALVLAATGMAVGLVSLLLTGKLELEGLRWGPVAAVAVIGVPLTVATNALEFWVTTWAVRRPVAAAAALRTTVLATAANVLPLPGGPLVRTHALQATGVRLTTAAVVTGAAGLLWVGLASVVAAWAGALAGAPDSLVWISGGVGLALCVAASIVVARAACRGRGWLTVVLLGFTEMLSVLTSAGRLYLVFLALGFSPDVPVVFVLAMAGVLATAVGVVPAGLGVREALSALLAVTVDVSAAVGFAVSLLDRVIGLAILVPLAAALAKRVDPSTEPR
jgi:uncharacterized membrane protein YbhN (UPF0104 family)